MRYSLDMDNRPEPDTDVRLPWRTLARTIAHHSHWRRFVVERVLTHTGAEIEYSYLEAPDAVYVVPVTLAGEIVLVRQYRHPSRAWLWEVPAGGVIATTPEAAARQELAEEIGGTAAELARVGEFRSSTGHLRQRNHVYLATGVRLDAHAHEPTELIEVRAVPAALALEMARTGQIDDGESALALLMCERLIRDYLARPTTGAAEQ